MTRSRLAMLLAAVAALAAAVLAGQPWFQGSLRHDGVSGDSLFNGLASALGWAALAGVALMLMLDSFGRRLVAGILQALSVLIIFLGLRPRNPSGIDDAAPDVIPGHGGAGQPATSVYAATGLAWAYCAAGAVLLVTALTIMLFPGQRRARTLETVTDGPRKPGEQWALLDRGIDPTEDL